MTNENLTIWLTVVSTLYLFSTIIYLLIFREQDKLNKIMIHKIIELERNNLNN